VDLTRDVLDKQVIDRNGREMGRVDGIVLDHRPGEAPRVSALLIGPSVLGDRLHPVIGRWVAAFEHALGIGEGRPVRIEAGDVTRIDDDVRVDLAVGETAAGIVEQRLRAWLTKIPGGR
jgi:sporulation protein YlmC with PRC-barrel domain